MNVHRCLMGILVLAMLTAPTALAFAAPRSPAPLVERQSDKTAHAYAERETASAAKVEKFQGGSAVYIGGSTLGIVLLVVILILIL